MPTLQGKAIRGSFPADLNSRMRIAGHSERGLGPAQTTYFLFSESGDLPDHTYAEGSLEVKTSSAEGRATQRPLHTASSQLREACTHTGGSWDTPNVDPGKSEWLAKVNSGKKWPIKVIQTDSRMWLRDSLFPSKLTCVSIHTYCILFPQNKYFTHFTTFCLCGNSFVQNRIARAGSLTPSLGARIWGSHCPNLVSVSGQGTEAPLQAAASWGHLRSIL